MTNQNPTGSDPKSVTTPSSGAAPKADASSENKRELTDKEIAAVAGGMGIKSGPGVGSGPVQP
jgi:hypothetical protein